MRQSNSDLPGRLGAAKNHGLSVTRWNRVALIMGAILAVFALYELITTLSPTPTMHLSGPISSPSRRR